MALQHWPSANGARGRLLLIHGLSSHPRSARAGPIRHHDSAIDIITVAEKAYVLAADGVGSVLTAPDRQELGERLPNGHLVAIEGGHCLHRDAPDDWLAVVASIIDS